jgi:hypothetical protein
MLDRMDTPLLLRERINSDDGYWQEWYCEVPPEGAQYSVAPGADQWSNDPETGEPLRKIYAVVTLEN